jgi:hypothetical protein
MPSRESHVVEAIRKAIVRRWPDAWTLKVVGGPYQESGIPDLLCCVNGRMVGLEVKYERPGESEQHALARATPRQQYQIRKINQAGGLAAVVTTPERAVTVIEAALRK